MKNYYNKPKLNRFIYIYIQWDNANEFCDRLLVLIASYNTVHKGQGSDTMSVIKELHKEEIIKENAKIFKTIFLK